MMALRGEADASTSRKGGSSNGWSLFGLAQALDMQGRTAEAAQVRLELDDAWARSDTWLRGSKF